MAESLEDQVQQIVERDAAAFAEMARLQKLDALEHRLHAMVDKVETKLSHVLRPLQLSAQQLVQAGLGQDEWGLHIGLDGQQSLVRGGPAVAAQPVATSGTLAGGQVQAGTGGVGGVTSPRTAAMSVLELQRMLIQINRMESKEQEVR
ncbi:hypothetical protein GPECTOR_70g487 [Gonium pectorale]|uniref:Uncharacterized protein n=1 Tax=Gonium pectorale TaxID=33097 RepID=A0A150G304_GONPE|nr:hypothetical protein GPECTOR_70g487 [Gonium pectorale]|eukprot:KXZ44256.1 hypothetical protein GPECTOR_70g487 [Gonium pectorale]